jgi:hypothetical protein
MLSQIYVLPVAVIGVALSVYLSKLTLPYPYDAFQSQPIPASHLDYFPGGAQAPLLHLYDEENNQHHQSDNKWLSGVRRLFDGQVSGVESVAVTSNGTLVLLDKFGYIHTATPTPKNDANVHDVHPADVDYTLSKNKLYIGPGRPLGYHIVEDEESEDLILLVCDTLKGLLRVNVSQRSIEVLTNMVTGDGTPINYANDVDIGPKSGKVYFTSSTSGVVGWNSAAGLYDTLHACILNCLRGDVSGRLLVYDFETKETKVLMENIFYANGVAVAADESYVLCVETWSYRVLKLWLDDGDKPVETFIGRLPGAPDGLSRSASNDNNFWVCLVANVSPLGKLAPYPFLRNLIGNLLIPLLPKISAKLMGSTAALKVSAQGEVLKVLLDPTSETLRSISGVTEHKGAVFFGSLSGDYVSVWKTD